MAYGNILGTSNKLVTASRLTDYPEAFNGGVPTDSKLLTKSDLKALWRTEEINASIVPGSRLLREKDVYKPANGYLFKYTTQNYHPWRISVILFEDLYGVWRNLMLDQSDIQYGGTTYEIDQINAKVKRVCHQLWTYGKLRSSSDGDLYEYSSDPNQVYETNVRKCTLYAPEESGWQQGVNPAYFKNTIFRATTDDSYLTHWQGTVIALMCFQTIWPNTSTNGSGAIHNDVNYIRFYDLGPDADGYDSWYTLNNKNSSIYNNNNYIKFSTDYIVKDDSWHNSSCNYTAYINSGYNIYGPFRWMWQGVFLDYGYSFIYE